MRTQHTNHGAFLGATQQTLFQLPPPPPGMQWHRADGWQEGDLPQGMRPYVQGETLQKGDEWRQYIDKKWQVVDLEDTGIGREPDTSHPFRTTRPLTFTHAGKTWTWHRPGDPMPCDGEQNIRCLFSDLKPWSCDVAAKDVRWSWKNNWSDIIGWRYADETKTDRFGPEDVMPGSAIYEPGWPKKTWELITGIELGGVRYGSKYMTWEELEKQSKINRSIPLTGRWNPDAWEPCSKEVLA